jgi:hypothetical protein
MIDIFGEDPEKIKALFEALVRMKMLSTRQDAYKNVVLSTPSRAALASVATFAAAFVRNNPGKSCLPDDALSLLRVLERLALAAPYDTSTVVLADLIKEGKRDGLNTSDWEKTIRLLATAGDEVKVVKASGGHGLRTTKKDVSGYVRNHELLAALYKANLA